MSPNEEPIEIIGDVDLTVCIALDDWVLNDQDAVRRWESL